MQTVFPNGRVLRGRYIVLQVLSQSRTAVTYLVKKVGDNQKLFVLKAICNTDQKDYHAVVRKAMQFRRLRHGALPQVYDVFTTPVRGEICMLMDYIEGQNLEVVRHNQSAQYFSVPQLITLLAPIVDAVAYLHSQHPPLFHRNIKPSNIIVTRSGDSTVLIGFDITEQYSEIMTSSLRYGLSGYKAPEQYSGETSARTDLYALGATIYALLTGTVPLDALYRLTELEDGKPDPLVLVNRIIPTIPRNVATSIHRAMSLGWNERFLTIKQFWGMFNASAKTLRSSSLLVVTRQSPAFAANPEVQPALEPLMGVEERPTFLANPIEQKTPEDVVAAEEPPTFISSAVEQQIPEPAVTTPTEEDTALTANSHVQQRVEPLIEVKEVPASPFIAEKAPAWDVDIVEEPIAEPAIALSGAHHPPATSEAIQRPVPASLKAQPAVQRVKKGGILLLTLFAVLITLLGSVAVGARFWFYTAGQHHPITALPSAANHFRPTSPPPQATFSPNVKGTSTPVPVSTPSLNVVESVPGSVLYTVHNGDSCDAILTIQMRMADAGQIFSDSKPSTVQALGDALGQNCHPLQPGMVLRLPPQYPLIAIGGVVLKIDATPPEQVRSPSSIAGAYQQQSVARCSSGCLLTVQIAQYRQVHLLVRTMLSLRVGSWIWTQAMLSRKAIPGFDNYPYVDPAASIEGMMLRACGAFQVDNTLDHNVPTCDQLIPNTIDNDRGAWLFGVMGSSSLGHWHYPLSLPDGTRVLLWLSANNGRLQFQPGNPVYRYDEASHGYE